MKTLINDLLTYSRVQTQQREFVLFPAEQALQTACQNLKVVIEENHVKIDYDSLPQVYGDPILVAQLLQNLMSNAIKFKRLNTVHLSLKAGPLDGGWWQFSFNDNGIGIEDEYFERIFAIFQRLHTREQYPGTGIGLAICKKVIERHGGTIWLESTVNVGTTFHFTLPGSFDTYEASTRGLQTTERSAIPTL
jgi:light-regulated signal transduction histidine kinase (bacteriophytochrome)